MKRVKSLIMAIALFVLLALPKSSEAAGWNPFPWGQCTYWAAEMRPDLIGSVWGNARDWSSEARWSGRPEGYGPAVGAIAVFQPWTYWADWDGHVAYVTGVGSGGWFQVSEMNFPFFGRVDYRWIRNDGNIQFIYR